MKLAIINPIERPVLPNAAGGGESWTARMAIELVKRENTIDLYATSGSLERLPKIKLKSLIDRGTNQRSSDEFFKKRVGSNAESMLTKFSATFATKALLAIKEKESNYDLVVDSSTDFIVSANWSFFQKPLVVIGHLPTSYSYIDIFNNIDLPENIYYVFPSMFQYNSATNIPESRKFFVPHGIDVKEISSQTINEKENLVWLGRIQRKNNKGLKEAIQTAAAIKKQLDVFGYIEDEQYYNELKSLSEGNVTFIQGETDKSVIFKKAKVFVFPILWEEAFGLVLLEAMATGTPVVAFARGAIPEIIKDGETGFIINPSNDDIRGNWVIKKTGLDGLCEAVQRIYALPQSAYQEMRRNAREHVEKNFTIEHMVDQYEEVFTQILNKKSS